MRNLFIVALAMTLLSGCRTTPFATCGADEETRDALHVLVGTDWSGITPEAVAKLWPSSVEWGAEAAGDERCSGTATFSNLARVASNECLCCDTFAFTDVLRDSKCERYLSSITLVRHFADEADARTEATQLLAGLGGTQKFALPVTTLTRQLSPISSEVTQLELTQAFGGWRVQLLIYRATAAEK